MSSINGEWNIIEVNGSKVTPGESRNLPFITFDTATGRLSGNSGCNRMMGSFDVNAKPGSIDFKGIAGTKMMCPDMTTERNVLGALAQVKGYKKAGKDKMYLCNDSNRPVVVLEKKEADVKLSVLNGEWKIKEVNGEAIPSGMEKQPFIAFDVKKKTIHGNAGCNLINGGFETSTSNAKSISFPGELCRLVEYSGPGKMRRTEAIELFRKSVRRRSRRRFPIRIWNLYLWTESLRKQWLPDFMI